MRFRVVDYSDGGGFFSYQNTEPSASEVLGHGVSKYDVSLGLPGWR